MNESCKLCNGNVNTFPLANEYIGRNLLEVAENVVKLKLTDTEYARSFICESCAGTLFLVNSKLVEYRRIFVQQPTSTPTDTLSPKKNANQVALASKLISTPTKVATPKKTAKTTIDPDIILIHDNNDELSITLESTVTPIKKTKQLEQKNAASPSKKSDTPKSSATATSTNTSIKSKTVESGHDISLSVDLDVDREKKRVDGPHAVDIGKRQKITQRRKTMVADTPPKTETVTILPAQKITQRRKTVVADIAPNTKTESIQPIQKITQRRKTTTSFECEFCSFETGVAKYMQTHLKEKHSVQQPKIYDCKQCSAKFVLRKSLTAHSNKVHPEVAIIAQKNELVINGDDDDDDEKTAKHLNSKKKEIILNGFDLTPVKSKPKEVSDATSDTKKTETTTKSKDATDAKKTEATKPKDATDAKKTEATTKSKDAFECPECSSKYASKQGLKLHSKKCHPELEVSNTLNASINHQEPAPAKLTLADHLKIANKKHEEATSSPTNTKLTAQSGGSEKKKTPKETTETSNSFKKPLAPNDAKKKLNFLSSTKLNFSKQDEDTTLTDSDSDDNVEDVALSKNLSDSSNENDKLKKPAGEKKSRVRHVFHFQCEKCDFSVNMANKFKEHLIEEHNEKEPRIFNCNQCNKSYSKNQTLQQHIKKLHAVKVNSTPKDNGIKTNNVVEDEDEQEEEVNQTLQPHSKKLIAAVVNSTPKDNGIKTNNVVEDEDEEKEEVNEDTEQLDETYAEADDNDAESCKSLPFKMAVFRALNESPTPQKPKKRKLASKKTPPLVKQKRKIQSPVYESSPEDLANDTERLLSDNEDDNKIKFTVPKKTTKKKLSLGVAAVKQKLDLNDSDVEEQQPIKKPKLSPSAAPKQKDLLNKSQEERNCPKCSKVLKSLDKYQNHVNKIHTHACNTCAASFLFAEALAKHKADNVCRDKKFHCMVATCKKAFSEMEKLKKHMRIKHSELQ